jgi:hypothetical protein
MKMEFIQSKYLYNFNQYINTGISLSPEETSATGKLNNAHYTFEGKVRELLSHSSISHSEIKELNEARQQLRTRIKENNNKYGPGTPAGFDLDKLIRNPDSALYKVLSMLSLTLVNKASEMDITDINIYSNVQAIVGEQIEQHLENYVTLSAFFDGFNLDSNDDFRVIKTFIQRPIADVTISPAHKYAFRMLVRTLMVFQKTDEGHPHKQIYEGLNNRVLRDVRCIIDSGSCEVTSEQIDKTKDLRMKLEEKEREVVELNKLLSTTVAAAEAAQSEAQEALTQARADAETALTQARSDAERAQAAQAALTQAREALTQARTALDQQSRATEEDVESTNKILSDAKEQVENAETRAREAEKARAAAQAESQAAQAALATAQAEAQAAQREVEAARKSLSPQPNSSEELPGSAKFRGITANLQGLAEQLKGFSNSPNGGPIVGAEESIGQPAAAARAQAASIEQPITKNKKASDNITALMRNFAPKPTTQQQPTTQRPRQRTQPTKAMDEPTARTEFERAVEALNNFRDTKLPDDHQRPSLISDVVRKGENLRRILNKKLDVRKVEEVIYEIINGLHDDDKREVLEEMKKTQPGFGQNGGMIQDDTDHAIQLSIYALLVSDSYNSIDKIHGYRPYSKINQFLWDKRNTLLESIYHNVDAVHLQIELFFDNNVPTYINVLKNRHFLEMNIMELSHLNETIRATKESDDVVKRINHKLKKARALMKKSIKGDILDKLLEMNKELDSELTDIGIESYTQKYYNDSKTSTRNLINNQVSLTHKYVCNLVEHVIKNHIQ